jgi:hypothetical protein
LDRSELTRQIHYEWWYKRALANIIIKNIMVFFKKTERYSIKKILNNLKLQEKNKEQNMLDVGAWVGKHA